MKAVIAALAANLGNLAEWATKAGDRDRARELLTECRELQASLGDSYNVIQCILSLGKLAADEGDGRSYDCSLCRRCRTGVSETN